MKLRGLFDNWVISQHQIASGGQAVLFDVPGTSFVYKRFKRPPTRSDEVTDLRGRLRELASTGQKVFVHHGSAPGQDVVSSFCWPVDVIEERQVPVGIVMPRASAEFFLEGGDKLRTFEFLYLYRTHPPCSLERAHVLLCVLRAFDYLGEMHLVHGDVAPKNIVWTLRPQPRVFVLDVDGMHKEGARYWHHVQTPEWEDPRVAAGLVDGHDLRSDWYALALLVLRSMLCSRYAVTAEARPARVAIEPPGALPATLASSLERVLTKRLDAAARPRPEQWASLLLGHFFPAGRADLDAVAKADVAVAQRRRWERRMGQLGPPSSDLSEVLSEAARA